MIFLPSDGPSFYTSVTWEQNEPPSRPPSNVPDGGITAMMFGAVLGGFVLLRGRRPAPAAVQERTVFASSCVGGKLGWG